MTLVNGRRPRFAGALLLLGVALACTDAKAQGESPEIPAEDRERFRALDRDGDGLLQPGEFPGTPAELAAADGDGDGAVSLLEVWRHAHRADRPAGDLGASLERARRLIQELFASHDLGPALGAVREAEAALAAGRAEDARAGLSGILGELERIARGEPSELLCRTALDRLEKVARVHEALGHDLARFRAAAQAVQPAMAARDWRTAREAIERAARELDRLNAGDRRDPTRINTDGFEAEPTVTGDGSGLYFQYSPRYLFKSRAPRQGPDRPGMTFADTEPSNDRIGVRTFRSAWDGERWSPPEVQAFPNEARDTQQPVFGCVVIGIAPDDRRASLIVYRTRGTRGDVALADRGPDGRWAAFQPLDRVNTEHTDEDGHFDLVPGSRRLYFLSDRPGGHGDADIYYLEGDRVFNVGAPTNTAAGEWFPQPDAFGNLYFTRDTLRVTMPTGAERPLELGGRADLPAMAPAITRDGSLIFYRLPVRVLDVALDADSDIFFSERTGPEPWAWSRPCPVEQRTRAHGERGLVHAAAYALARVVSALESQGLACAAEAGAHARTAEGRLQAGAPAEAFQAAYTAWSLITAEAPERVLLRGRQVAAAAPPDPTLPSPAGRLLPPERGAYVGTWSQDASPDMASLARFQRLCGVRVQLDHLDVSMQRLDGTLQPLGEPVRLTAAGPDLVPPPLRLMKVRADAGIVTALQLHVPDGNTDSAYAAMWRSLPDETRRRLGLSEAIPSELRVWMQDVLDGRHDAYFLAAARALREFGRPVLVEFLNEFDAHFSQFGFGPDGKTHLMDVLNGPGFFQRVQAFQEQNGRPPRDPSEVGLTGPPRMDGPELRSAYGDPEALDGPERVRDAWRHVHDLFDEVGAANVTWYNHAADGRGRRDLVDRQPLAAYYPGANYVDWAGSSSYARDPSLDERAKGPTLGVSIMPWYRETSTSGWSGCPLLLHEMSQVFWERPNVFQGKDELPQWFAEVFGRRLPESLPRVKAFLLIYNNFGPVETWTPAEVAALRQHVGESSYYGPPLCFSSDRTPPGRVTDLRAEEAPAGEGGSGGPRLAWTAPGGDGEAGAAMRYVIRYRTDPMDRGGGVEKDFRREPWRLWSSVGTRDLTPVPPQPAQAGTVQYLALPGLPSGTYYVALQAVDDVPYNGRLSNVVEVRMR